MLLSVALVRADVSEERIASIIRVTRISELGITVNIILNALTFPPDDGGDMFLRNVVSYKSHTA
jgi:hypothetical protein